MQQQDNSGIETRFLSDIMEENDEEDGENNMRIYLIYLEIMVKMQKRRPSIHHFARSYPAQDYWKSKRMLKYKSMELSHR